MEALKKRLCGFFGVVPVEYRSYSQCGEDTIISFLLNWIGEKEVRYLDLGANDPIHFSNTYRFYKAGWSGVLVEPDPGLAEKIRAVRPRDICLETAVGVTTESTASFYRMTADTLSTTLATTAEKYERDSEHRLERVSKVGCVHINQLLSDCFGGKPPTFVSLDVEGLDFKILEAWDFDLFRPPVFCVETLTYSQKGNSEKVHEIFDVMKKNGYMVYADTFINTVFVSGAAWSGKDVVKGGVGSDS